MPFTPWEYIEQQDNILYLNNKCILLVCGTIKMQLMLPKAEHPLFFSEVFQSQKSERTLEYKLQRYSQMARILYE